MAETINMPNGAMDLDDAGVFQELRATGVRVRRLSQTHLVLETASGGNPIHITSHFQIDVKSENGNGTGR